MVGAPKFCPRCSSGLPFQESTKSNRAEQGADIDTIEFSIRVLISLALSVSNKGSLCAIQGEQASLPICLAEAHLLLRSSGTTPLHPGPSHPSAEAHRRTCLAAFKSSSCLSSPRSTSPRANQPLAPPRPVLLASRSQPNRSSPTPSLASRSTLSKRTPSSSRSYRNH